MARASSRVLGEVSLCSTPDTFVHYGQWGMKYIEEKMSSE